MPLNQAYAFAGEQYAPTKITRDQQNCRCFVSPHQKPALDRNLLAQRLSDPVLKAGGIVGLTMDLQIGRRIKGCLKDHRLRAAYTSVEKEIFLNAW